MEHERTETEHGATVELPLTFTVEQAAVLLGISRGSTYAAAHTGELPTVRIGRRLLVPRARLLELLSTGSPGTAPEGGDGTAPAAA